MKGERDISSPPQFTDGDTVITRTQNQSTWNQRVVKAQIHPRSYVIEDAKGSQYSRNPQDIRRCQSKITPTADVIPDCLGPSKFSQSQSFKKEPRLVLRRSTRARAQPQRLQ